MCDGNGRDDFYSLALCVIVLTLTALTLGFALFFVHIYVCEPWADNECIQSHVLESASLFVSKHSNNDSMYCIVNSHCYCLGCLSTFYFIFYISIDQFCHRLYVFHFTWLHFCQPAFAHTSSTCNFVLTSRFIRSLQMFLSVFVFCVQYSAYN